MKWAFLALIVSPIITMAQSSVPNFPVPDYSNEIYYFKKDESKLMRLEKNSSKFDHKTKAGGFGGVQAGYEMDGDRSSARLKERPDHVFLYYSGPPAGSNPSSDSVMRANGMDPAMMNMSHRDPSQLIELFEVITDKGVRKVVTVSSQGMKLLGGKKKDSKKYTTSIRQVKPGYYEIIVDKPLPKGEYAFVFQGMGISGDVTLFAFAIE